MLVQQGQQPIPLHPFDFEQTGLLFCSVVEILVGDGKTPEIDIRIFGQFWPRVHVPCRAIRGAASQTSHNHGCENRRVIDRYDLVLADEIRAVGSMDVETEPDRSSGQDDYAKPRPSLEGVDQILP